PAERNIALSAGTQTVNFSLRADPFRLEEVVVTGVSSATSQKKLTFSVATVSEAQMREVPASSPIAALAGKVSGAKIAIGRGNPGSQPSIRLRGSTNLGVGTSTPLILVDGVITASTIADIDANDIESIEILKGAAAASFYGSNGANGVVNITTKRGRNLPDNKLAFTLRSEYGQSGFQRYVPLNESHFFVLNPDGRIRQTAARQRVVDFASPGIAYADNPYPAIGPDRWRNQLKTWLEDGVFYSNNLQLGLRRGNTNFHTSYTADRNQGIVPFTNGQHRQNVRLNVDQGLGSKADLSLSTTYGINKNDYDPDGAPSWFNFMQMPGDVDLRNPSGTDPVEFFPMLPQPKAGGSARSNPLYDLVNREFDLRRERIIGSASLRYRPMEWLRLESSYGTDRLNRLQTSYGFRGILGEQGNPLPGDLSRFTQNIISDNMSARAIATKQFGPILSTTGFAYSYEQNRNSSFSAGGSKLNVNAVPDLDALDPAQISIGSSQSLARSESYMGSQAFDIRDRYLLDFLIRNDGSSLFGPGNRRENFYRVSGAWRISEDFSIPGVQEFKIRAAQGTAGLRPSFLNQYETYSVNDGQISKSQQGNKLLKPAIQTETEFGFNTTFANRFDLEVVQANRVT
ncbi:MAG: TonB-dependent receptor plug domain-containing protein, partial [Phycisphaerales bacterium]|nr:TonB-dependent receptor plug domain-containing protein [Phycisphaerales bacterium]